MFLGCETFFNFAFLQLHSFVRAYPVSSAVMTPFYMNREKIFCSIFFDIMLVSLSICRIVSVTSWNHVRGFKIRRERYH